VIPERQFPVTPSHLNLTSRLAPRSMRPSLLIPRSGMRLNEAPKMGVQLADALAAARRVGIADRDLKPANVMVNENGSIKILDFGLVNRGPYHARSSIRRSSPGICHFLLNSRCSHA
jgi:serine/threonine protein kinase